MPEELTAEQIRSNSERQLTSIRVVYPHLNLRSVYDYIESLERELEGEKARADAFDKQCGDLLADVLLGAEIEHKRQVAEERLAELEHRLADATAVAGQHIEMAAENARVDRHNLMGKIAVLERRNRELTKEADDSLKPQIATHLARIAELEAHARGLAGTVDELEAEKLSWERPAARWRKMRKAVASLIKAVNKDLYDSGYRDGVGESLSVIDSSAGSELSESDVKEQGNG